MAKSSTPLYLQVKNEILNQIESNLLHVGDKLPTENQLMEAFHVSRFTITKALNELKAEGILSSTPGQGTFIQKAPAARADSASDADACPLIEIACIFPDIKDSFALSMLNGIQSVFPSDRYLLHIFQSKTISAEDHLLRYCLNGSISGIVLFPLEQAYLSDTLTDMHRRNYPLVLVDREIPLLENSSYVVNDHEAAGTLCMKYLRQLGHERVAFITPLDQETGSIRLRIEGIRKEFRQSTLSGSFFRVVQHMKLNKSISFYQEFFRKLIFQDKITALIASDSSCCIYLYRLLESMSLSVPNDISLLSFDNPQTGPHNINYFTYIDQSEYTIGREAGNILLRKLEDNNRDCCRKLIAPQLEIHQSTADLVR
ncbi:MAG: GntR family transcriptional regulator [Lachnospiraceae bacterium]|nr:GntR family transcriptional regulator [Lachnospiraceae bacterium]